MTTKRALGVCYYPEHWPQSRWPQDARMMRQAGIRFVRIGEFAWSMLEPEPGKYDFDWLEHAIEILHGEGLEVVLGTPTATPPKWLVDTMPDMLPVGENGLPRKFGSRRHYCFSHQGYRTECVRIVTALAKKFGDHPAVTAWQTDNEYGCHETVLSYSSAALTGFREWLSQKYQSPQALNRAWGNRFWSKEYRKFDEIELPNSTVTEANPAHRLDFQRYSSNQVIAFNRLQTDIIRKHSPGRTILHNFMGSFTDFDHFAVSRDLDAASWDSYPIGFLDRDVTDPERRHRYLRVGDPDMQSFHHDLYRGCGRGRWWVMEQQPGPVNWAPHNPSPVPGALRLWAWEAFSCGAETVSYFRWRQAPFGQEQMHEGLLLPDGSINEAYETVETLTGELVGMDVPAGSTKAPVALVFDYESAWAWSIQPQGQSFSYLALVKIYYRALRALGVTVDIIPADPQLVKDYALVLMPGLFELTEDLCEALGQDGQIVLAGPRTGSRTGDFAIPDTLPPGAALQRRLAVKVRRVDTIPPPESVAIGSASSGFCFTTWREMLAAENTVIVDEWTDDGQIALCRDDTGSWNYTAGQPNAAYALKIIEHLCERAGVQTMQLHQDIRIRDNGRMRYIFNHGPESVQVAGLIADNEVLIGSSVLPPCGVTICRK